MTDFAIGLSGLKAAQGAIDIIGNNISNSATEGYHKQVVRLSPSYFAEMGGVFIGGGVTMEGAVRMIDTMLEKEILNQSSLLSGLGQDLTTLSTIEKVFGEFLSDGTLSVLIDDFFNSLEDLSLSPTDGAWQNQTLSSAQALISQFGYLGSFMDDLQSQIRQESEIIINEINQLTTQVAALNDNILKLESAGTDTSSLRDQRDKCLTDLSELVGIDVRHKENGICNVVVSNVAIVSGRTSVDFGIGNTDDGQLGLVVADATTTRTNFSGGKLGALISLSNGLIADLQEQLDALAVSFMEQFNRIHVQSVGLSGSFTSLAGAVSLSDLLSENESVSDGTFYIRVTDTQTGQITRHAVDVVASTESLADIAAKIDLIDGLTASVFDSRLSINANPGYEFDFMPTLLPEPSTSDLAIDTAISGIYSGSGDKTYTCTVVGDGDLSNTDGLSLQVDVDGQIIKTVNIGTGYAAGDLIEIEEGVFVSLSAGSVTNGQSFTIEALASTDSSGLLCTAGMNTFFKGTRAADMVLCPGVADDLTRIAIAQGPDMTDTHGLKQMIDLRTASIEDLSGLTFDEYYRRFVSDLGQTIYLKDMQHENAANISQSLANQQAEISGVDINEQATQMIIYEQMFQIMAKYIETIQTTLSTLVDII